MRNLARSGWPKGVVQYNLPVGPDGHIPPSTAEKMAQVGKGVAK